MIIYIYIYHSHSLDPAFEHTYIYMQKWRHAQSLYDCMYFYSLLTCMIEWLNDILLLCIIYNKINMWTWFHWPLILWWHHCHRGHADLLLLHFALLPWGSFEGGLPPSPQVLVLEGHWGLLSPGRLKLHTRGKEYGTGKHAQQTEVMQSLPLHMYTFTNVWYTFKYMRTYVRMYLVYVRS